MGRGTCSATAGIMVVFYAALSMPPVSASAAPRLVVLATDSGSDITAPYNFQPPQLTAGAKGFLIGLDTGDLAEPTALGFQDLMLRGDGLITLDDFAQAGSPNSSPHIVTRTEAQLRGLDNGVNYAREATYVVDQPQSTSLGDRNWMLIAPGLDSGEGYIRMAGFLGFGLVPQGVYPLAYIVTTGDLSISGMLAPGTDSTFAFDVAGNRLGNTSATPVSILDFATGAIVPDPHTALVAASIQPPGMPVGVPIVPPVVEPPVEPPLVVEPPVVEPALVPPGGEIALPPVEPPVASPPLPEYPTPVQIPPMAEIPVEVFPFIPPTADEPVLPGDVPTTWDPSPCPIEIQLILSPDELSGEVDVTTLPDGVILTGLKHDWAIDGLSGGSLTVTGGPYLFGAVSDTALAFGRANSQNMPGGEHPPAPEPSSLLLASAALLGLAILGRRLKSLSPWERVG